MRALPENPSPPESLSSTSPERRRRRRDGSGRIPPVQPEEWEKNINLHQTQHFKSECVGMIFSLWNQSHTTSPVLYLRSWRHRRLYQDGRPRHVSKTPDIFIRFSRFLRGFQLSDTASFQPNTSEPLLWGKKNEVLFMMWCLFSSSQVRIGGIRLDFHLDVVQHTRRLHFPCLA